MVYRSEPHLVQQKHFWQLSVLALSCQRTLQWKSLSQCQCRTVQWPRLLLPTTNSPMKKPVTVPMSDCPMTTAVAANNEQSNGKSLSQCQRPMATAVAASNKQSNGKAFHSADVGSTNGQGCSFSRWWLSCTRSELWSPRCRRRRPGQSGSAPGLGLGRCGLREEGKTTID